MFVIFCTRVATVITCTRFLFMYCCELEKCVDHVSWEFEIMILKVFGRISFLILKKNVIFQFKQ